MFTGLVEEVGRVMETTQFADSVRLRISGPLVTTDAEPGDSIAVNGVCLTVVEVLPVGQFTTDVMAETLNRSTLREIDQRPEVNLERAVKASGRLGGHIVQGHVDGTGKVISRTPSEHWEVVRVALPGQLSRYVVEKGSIAVNGVSLTVSGVGGDDAGQEWFEVSLIPTTLADTNLSKVPVGGALNLEVDVLAKYVERMLARDSR